MKPSKSLLLFILCVIFFTSCKKDLGTGETISVPKTEVKNGPIPPYLFNWETATYMPSPGSSNQVPMPWNSGTSSIDPNLVSDYKAVDGWEMVWNTFSPTTALNDPSHTYFFSLYNKYRGQLRFYLWQQATPIATSFISHGLQLYGATSSHMLDYNSNEIVDMAGNQTQFTQVLNQQINASGGTWLVFQYEIAYDPSITSSNFPAFGLTWASQWVNVSSMNLNGNLVGTIKGNLGSPSSPGVNFVSLLVKGALTVWGGLGTAAFLTAIAKAGEDPYTGAMDKAKNGAVEGFFNGVIGGILGSSGQQPVSLTINSEIHLGGNVISNGGLEDMKLALPGQANSQTADGNTPAFNDVMGLFRLTAKPVVSYARDDYQTGPIENPYDGSPEYSYWIVNTYTLNPNSFGFDWNPAIINATSTGATISNLKTQIVQFFENDNINSLTVVNNPYSLYQSTPFIFAVLNKFETLEQVGNRAVIASTGNPSTPLQFVTPYGSLYWKDGGLTAVRVSFDVVPNNGGPVSKIVKTFLANVVPQ